MSCGMSFSDIASIKVVGPRIGAGRPSAPGKMRDADNDGKCQEENGNWIPCPPGVSDGNIVNAAGQAVRRIGEPIGKRPIAKPQAPDKMAERRKKAADKIARIAEIASEGLPKENIGYASEAKSIWDDLRLTPKTVSTRTERNRMIRELKEAVSEAFTYEITATDGSKYSVSVDTDSIKINEDRQILITGDILDSKGKKVGQFDRTISPADKTATHHVLTISDKHQGKGIAAQLNARNELLYKEFGIKQIKVEALSSTSYKGATHWPRQGYDWASWRDRYDYLSVIEAAIRKHKEKNRRGKSEFFDTNEQAEELAELVRRAKAEPFETANRLTAGDLLDWPGADVAFKKALATMEFVRSI